MRTLVLTTVFASILGSAKWSTAEINMADSIEWITADSDLAVVGRVIAVSERKGAGETIWYRATVAVSDTLKGTPAKSIGFVMRGFARSPNPATWKASKAELMLFLTDWKRRPINDGDNGDYGKEPYVLSHGRQGDNVIALDGTGKASAFAVLSKRDELIAAVRAGAKSTAEQALQIQTPLGSPAGKALWGGSPVFLYVPIDAALEQRGVGWIASRDAHERDRGVLVLSHFKSAANIKRLEGLLADTGWIDITEGNNPMVRRFFVRKRAHETLVAWGVPHATPPIDSRPPP